jgi:hypothetical protein
VRSGDETAQAAQSLSLLPCVVHNVHVTDQPGPTQALWKGTDTTATAPALSPTAEFVFVFDKLVSTDALAQAATITLQSCPGSPNPPAHAVPVQVALTSSWFSTALTIRHATEPFAAGCTYALSIASTQPLNGVLQCLDKSAGFTFRVREKNEATPLPKDAVSVRYRPKAFDVAAFRLPSTLLHVSPSAIFQRYAEDLRIRPYIDTFVADPAGSSGYQVYIQNYYGIPVSGYGYVLANDANGNVRTANGHIAKGIDLDFHPIVLDAAAVVAATAAVLSTQKFSILPVLLPDEKKLMIVSRTQSPAAAQFRLAWSIRLVDQISKRSFTTVIDARDLSVIRFPTPSGRDQCAVLDVARLPSPTPSITGHVSFDPQTTLYADPNMFEMSQYANGASSSFVLRTEGVGAQAAPLLLAQCGTVPNDTTLATVPDTVFDASARWTPEVTSTAASYMGVQRTMEYLVAHQVTQIGLPQALNGWIGADGNGQTSIRVQVESRDGNFFEPPASPGGPDRLEFEWSTGSNAGTGAALDSTGHEFGHAIRYSIFPSHSNRELGALDEAFGDMLGATVEHTVRSALNVDWADSSNPVNWCQGGDVSRNATDGSTIARCLRDLRRPDRSFQTFSTAPTQPGGPPNVPHVIKSPNAYKDCNYYDPATGFDLDRFVHYNSTVVSHWFYLLIAGGTGTSGGFCDAGTTDVSCDYSITGPAPSWDEAFAIVLHGLQRMGIDGGFEDFANATVSVADDLFPAGPDHDAKVKRVVDAWAAVGIWERYWEGLTTAIIPARNEVGVSPWQPIEWLAGANESAWEVEVATDASFTALYAATTVTETELRNNGQRYGVLRVALAPNTPYFWRERAVPTTSSSWDCSPAHFFQTGDVPKVDGIKITANLAPDGKVRPGTITAQWQAVTGATSYKIDVDFSDPHCAQSGSVPEVTVPASSSSSGSVTGLVSGIQPSTSYTLDVQAIGPKDPNQIDATSTCAGIVFPTANMRPPVPTAPLDGAAYGYQSPHDAGAGHLKWTWDAFDGPETFQVAFYVRNADGTCGASIVASETVTASCPASADGKCAGELTRDLFPAPTMGTVWANPTGYCWEVASVAKNKVVANSVPASPRQHFSNTYELTGPVPISPGLYFGASVAQRDPGVIPNRTYEDTSPLTFTWKPIPIASDYFFTLGRWPWLKPGPVQPQNCVDPRLCDEGPVEVKIPPSKVTGAAVASVTAASAGRGRYCWTVWPELQDPSDATKANALQPLVDPYSNVYCYSTEAAKPQITYDGPLPDGHGFSEKPLAVKIKFPYVPDAAPVLDDMNHNIRAMVTQNAACDDKTENDPLKWQPGDNFIFHDHYDCEYDLTISPEPSSHYHLRATAPGYATNPSDDLVFDTGSCGTTGESCCDNNVCKDGSTCHPSSGKCEKCNADGDACCTGGTCDQNGPSNLSCRAGRCLGCGGQAGPCCDPPVASACGIANTTCISDKCVDCGQVAGRPCCANGGCGSNTTLQCDSSTHTCKEPCETPSVPTGLSPGQTGPTPDASFGPGFVPAQQPVSPHWNPVAGAVSYNVRWVAVSMGADGTLGFISDQATESTSTTSITSTRMNDRKTFFGLEVGYQVQAVGNCGATSAFSPVFYYWLSSLG